MGLGGIGMPELLIVAAIVGVVFGLGKLPGTLGDLGKGIRQFRENVRDAEDAVSEAERQVRGG